jgi:3-oxoacyl-[acyl-carrier protein] reductase
VTGGSRGIGAACVAALAADGWPVGLNFRNDAEGAARVSALAAETGGRVMALQHDICDPEAVEAMFDELEAAFGPVLIVVNNAGVRNDGLALQLGDAAWDQVLDTNLGASFRTCRRALRGMIKARFGRIVNISSVIATKANPGQANYAASKAGIIGMTKSIAAEVARRGITVNAVAPGIIDTDFLPDDMREADDNRLVAAIPARRVGTAREVAACVRFLASDEAAYVTGSTLTVDGGLTA